MTLRLLAVAVPVAVTLFGQLTGEQSARVKKLENTLLAPCCYSEPVAQHRSEVSLRMRAEIRRMVAEGKSGHEILEHYKKKYGLRVLVEPEGDLRVWIHVVPLAAIVGSLFGGAYIIRKWLKPLPADPARMSRARRER